MMHESRTSLLRRIVLLASLLLFFSVALRAQTLQHGALRGTVTVGEQGSPVPGAIVTILGTRQGTVSNSSGEFIIPDLGAGKYDVEASFTGYKRERSLGVEVLPGRETTVSFRLTESPFLLGEVVVTGSLQAHLLKDTPVITEIIARKDLAATGSADLAEVMRAQTGVEISTGIGQTQSVQLHGLSDSHVLILVDGERVTGRVDGAVDLGQIPLNTIEKIEVVKGPLSSIYGSEAIGGVVNIITKDPAQAAHLLASSTFGSYGRQDYDIAAAHSFHDMIGEGSLVKLFLNTGWNKFFGVDYDPGDNFMEMPEYDRKNAGLKSIVQLNSSASLDLKLEYYKDRSEWMAGTRSLYLNDVSSNEKLTASAVGEYKFSPLTKIRLSSHYSGNDHVSSEQTLTGFFTRDDASKESIRNYRAQFSTAPYETSLLTMGFEHNIEGANSTRLSGGKKLYINNVIYGEDEWTFSRLLCTIGGRYSNNSVYGSFFSPRLSLMYKATDNLTLRGSYGRGFRAPSIMELFIDFANNGVGYIVNGEPALQAETSHGYNVGIQYTRDDLVWFRVNLYYNQLTNLIDYYVRSKTPIVLSYRNVSQAVTKGVDVDVDLHLFDNLILGIGYAYTYAKDGNGNELPFRAPHSASWKIQYLLPGPELSVHLRGRWFDRKLVTDEQTNLDIYSGGGGARFFHTPAYALLDVRISRKLFEHFDLSAGLNNLTNWTYYPFGQIKGREIFGGLTFHLD